MNSRVQQNGFEDVVPAVSIPSSLAEGACRKSDAAFRNHVAIALGSRAELETCIEIARRLHYLSDSAASDLSTLCTQSGKLLNGLFKSLEPTSQQPHRSTAP